MVLAVKLCKLQGSPDSLLFLVVLTDHHESPPKKKSKQDVYDHAFQEVCMSCSFFTALFVSSSLSASRSLCAERSWLVKEGSCHTLILKLCHRLWVGGHLICNLTLCFEPDSAASSEPGNIEFPWLVQMITRTVRNALKCVCPIPKAPGHPRLTSLFCHPSASCYRHFMAEHFDSRTKKKRGASELADRPCAERISMRAKACVQGTSSF